MRLHVTRETLARLREEKSWTKLTLEQQEGWRMALAAHLNYSPLELGGNIVAQATRGDPALGKVGKSFLKTLVQALGVRDPDGPPSTTKASPCRTASSPTTKTCPWARTCATTWRAKCCRMSPTHGWTSPSAMQKDGEIGRVGYEINFNRDRRSTFRRAPSMRSTRT